MSGTGGTGEVVPSPCVRICVVDAERQQCSGCRRTLAEIAAWRRLSDAERLAVLADLPARRAAADG